MMGTIKRRYKVERSQINYLSTIIGSYDGAAFTLTIDPRIAIIELRISPYCTGLITELLKSLVKEEGIRIEEVLNGYE